MKKRYIFVSGTALLAFWVLFISASSLVTAQDKVSKIDSLMQIYHDYGQFNGTVLVAQGGNVIYKKASDLPIWNGTFPTSRIQNSGWVPSPNNLLPY